jgi:hypothetical protein
MAFGNTMQYYSGKLKSWSDVNFTPLTGLLSGTRFATDGTTWVVTTYEQEDFAYVKKFAYSIDQKEWTDIVLPETTVVLFDIHYAAGEWMAVGQNFGGSTTTTPVYRSDDGKIWSESGNGSSIFKEAFNVAHHDGKWFIIGVVLDTNKPQMAWSKKDDTGNYNWQLEHMNIDLNYGLNEAYSRQNFYTAAGNYYDNTSQRKGELQCVVTKPGDGENPFKLQMYKEDLNNVINEHPVIVGAKVFDENFIAFTEVNGIASNGYGWVIVGSTGSGGACIAYLDSSNGNYILNKDHWMSITLAGMAKGSCITWTGDQWVAGGISRTDPTKGVICTSRDGLIWEVRHERENQVKFLAIAEQLRFDKPLYNVICNDLTLSTSQTPISSTESPIGTIQWDDSNLYIRTGTSWKKVALTSLE